MTLAAQGTAPLHGVRVLAVEQAVAAPFATRQLADLGAEVIKIERPGGGDFARDYDRAVSGLSSYFFWLNRGKKSVVLDLRSEDGRARLAELTSTADVLVHNLAPAAAHRLGLTAALLRPDYPSLIICQIRGYGPDGPNADRKAYDLLIQCETGMAVATGGVDHPTKVGVSIADIAAGMYAFSGILAALYERAAGGVARDIDISLFDSLAEWMSVPAYLTAGTGRETPVLGLAHPTIAPYGPHSTADGSVVLAVQNEREWRRLCLALLNDSALADHPHFASNTQRVAHRAELDELLETATCRLSSAQLIQMLDECGIAHARVHTMREFLNHPEITARRRFVPVDVPGGTSAALLPPIRMSGSEPVMGAVPAIGQHTAEVLRGLTEAPTRNNAVPKPSPAEPGPPSSCPAPSSGLDEADKPWEQL
jgi:itaconate CoA-transferase